MLQKNENSVFPRPIAAGVGAGRQGFEKLSLEAGAYLIGLEHMSSRLKILNLPR